MFVLLPFVLGSRTMWDWFFLTCALFLIGVYTLYIGNEIMYGPRYWYPAAPFLMLLAARGAERAAVLLTDAAGSSRAAVTRDGEPPRWAGVLVVYALVAALIGSSVLGWLLSRDIAWSADFVPETAISLKGFSQADDRLIRVIEDAHLKNALVLVEECTIWQCYGTAFGLNSADTGWRRGDHEERAGASSRAVPSLPRAEGVRGLLEDRLLIPYRSPRRRPGSGEPQVGELTVALRRRTSLCRHRRPLLRRRPRPHRTQPRPSAGDEQRRRGQ